MIETLTTLNIGSVSLGILAWGVVMAIWANWGERKQREEREREREEREREERVESGVGF